MNKILIICSLFFGYEVFSQNNVSDTKLNDELFLFLNDKGETEKDQDISALYNVAVLVSDDNNYGVYKFGLLGSHRQSYIYLKRNRQIEILDDYSLPSILSIMSNFFNETQDKFRDKEGLSALNLIVKILQNNLKIAEESN